MSRELSSCSPPNGSMPAMQMDGQHIKASKQLLNASSKRNLLGQWSGPARNITNSTARLTSLLLQQQEVESQLCTLENILKAHDAPVPILPIGVPLLVEPFSGRLAGVLASTSYESNSENVELLSTSINCKLLETNDRLRPAPLNIQASKKNAESPTTGAPHSKKTVDSIIESYEATALKLAAVELEIETVYMSTDNRWTWTG